MILHWGSHVHGRDEVGVKIKRRAIFDAFNRRIAEIHEWTIIGAIKAASKAALTTALDTLETAYQTDDVDLKLYLSDGVTLTQHTLLNSDSFGGTKVVAFGYMDGPWKMQTEYANRRTFYAVVRAEVRTGTGLYAFRENLRVKGTGAPKWRYMPSLKDAPEPQGLQLQTPFAYIQRGTAVGRQSYPSPAAPLFPSILHGDVTEFSYDTPKDIRTNGEEMFATSWTYIMEATAAQGFNAFNLPGVN